VAPRTRLAIVILAATAFLALTGAAAAKPNLLFILTDDQRADTLSVMPATASNFDVVFRKTIVTTPECCPSRVSTLTGEYGHNHGVHSNLEHSAFTAREAESLGPWLREQGYYTGFIGKYLNRYLADEPVPHGWDEFRARVWNEDGTMIGDGYTSFSLREYWHQGPQTHSDVVEYPNPASPNVYSTRRFGSLAQQFIERAHNPDFNPDGKPWALFVWTAAPHVPLIAEDDYADAPVPAWKPQPSFLEPNMRDKPREVRLSPLRRPTNYPFAAERTGALRLLMSVDDLVKRVWDAVDDFGERENTWGLFASDNGYFLGEHRLSKKLHGYEEAIRVPFRLAVPNQDARKIKGVLAANIDIAPTFLELAGGSPQPGFDGRSLVPLVQGGAASCPCSRTLMIENWDNRRYTGLRTNWWKYIRWPSGREELYDLRRDRFELQNLAHRHAQAYRLARMREALAVLAQS
jgi:N-acetylglucosamine-6-sulfatase